MTKRLACFAAFAVMVLTHAHAHELTRAAAVARLQPSATSAVAAAPSEAQASLEIRVVDADSGRPIAATARIRFLGSGRYWKPEMPQVALALYRTEQWYTLAPGYVLELPADQVEIEVFRGVEWTTAKTTADLRAGGSHQVDLTIKRWHDIEKKGWIAGNTHLHVQQVNRAYADRYLEVVPEADDMRVVFVSYLERAGDDQTYASNEYRTASLETLARKLPSTRFGWGEEMRHNFGAFGEGYGHVLLLNIDELIRPVSIGPSLTNDGADAPALAPGIDAARRQGGMAVWAHNDFGLEDVPNWVMQRLAAQNNFDGGEATQYDASYYRYLDIGVRVPFSTGTDWFMFDLTRVYVEAQTTSGIRGWSQALVGGKSFITNEPLLFLKANGQSLGETVQLARASGPIRIEGSALGRNDFRRIELIYNGRVIHTARASLMDGVYRASIDFTLLANEPGWIAMRVPWENNRNALGNVIRAHTSPIYVTVKGRSRFDPNTARGLIREMHESLALIDVRSRFDTSVQRDGVRAVYLEAIAQLERQIAQHRR